MLFSLPFATSLIVFGTLCLLAFFMLAALAKLRHTARAREGLISFGVSAAWARAAHGVLVLEKVLIAASFTDSPTLWWLPASSEVNTSVTPKAGDRSTLGRSSIMCSAFQKRFSRTIA